MDPLRVYYNDIGEIHKKISSAKGTHRGSNLPHRAVMGLSKKCIKQLETPALESMKAVKKHLDDYVVPIATDCEFNSGGQQGWGPAQRDRS